MLLRDDFIGTIENNCELLFFGHDNLEAFNERKLREGENWYYKDKVIKYNLNKYGHRCKNPEEINLDNYILFTGCSHSLGMGLELDKSYPYLLSKLLNYDYYNLGVAGSGTDVLMHNLTVWLNKYKKPKKLIIQWPYWARCSVFPPVDVHNDGRLKPIGPWSQAKEDLDLLVAGEEINYFKSLREFAKLQIKSYNIPVYFVTPSYGGPFPEYCYELLMDDTARDKHHGIKSNLRLSVELYKGIKNDELNYNRISSQKIG